MLSVVIPTYHRNDLLAECLKLIAPEVQQFDEAYEVIVTDDGKKTTAQSMIAKGFPWATWVEGPHDGPAKNRNNGARNAANDWIVFLDDDCLPDADLLQSYKKAIQENPTVKVFEGKIYADREQRRFDEESPINLTGGKLWSCNFCVQKAEFNRLGGFDEDFPFATMEDMDLRLRLKDAGNEILFLPSAAVCHPWRKIKGWAMYKKRYISYKYFMNKYPEKKKFHTPISRIKILISRFLEGLGSLVKYRFRGISNFFYRTAIDVMLIFVR
ncbi:MAG: glycosyltransferase [Bacteroidota bacterium]